MSKFKAGEILSETSFYKVKKVEKDRVTCEVIGPGNEVAISLDYISNLCISASKHSTSKKVSRTDLIQLIKASSNMAITVSFTKQDKNKTKKTYNEEVKKKAEEVKESFLQKGQIAIEEAIKHPVLPYIPGEERVLIGAHKGVIDNHGRLKFTDLEINEERLVDPRTINYAIINNVYYSIK